MLLIDTYLQRHGLKRYDVHKQSGLSNQLLSQNRNKRANELSVKVIEAIAQTVYKTPGEVLNELLALQVEAPTFRCYDKQDLLLALENQELSIVIDESFFKEAKKLMDTQLSNDMKEIKDISFRGSVALMFIFNLLLGSKDVDDKIIRKLDNYNIFYNNDETIHLVHRYELTK